MKNEKGKRDKVKLSTDQSASLCFHLIHSVSIFSNRSHALDNTTKHGSRSKVQYRIELDMFVWHASSQASDLFWKHIRGLNGSLTSTSIKDFLRVFTDSQLERGRSRGLEVRRIRKSRLDNLFCIPHDVLFSPCLPSCIRTKLSGLNCCHSSFAQQMMLTWP